MTDKQILEEVDNAMKLGRKQALKEVYQIVKELFSYRIKMHNSDYDNARDNQYKYDLSRDAREFNANYNMILDRIKEMIDAECEDKK